MNRWIKLYTNIKEFEYYKDSKTMLLFIHCLLNAVTKDTVYKHNLIRVGSFATTTKTLATETGLTISNIRTSLKYLTNSKQITIKTTNKYSIITIVNYSKYQTTQRANNKQITNKQQTNNKQTTSVEVDSSNIINNITTKDIKSSRATTTVTLQMIENYIAENNLNVNAEKFFNYYDFTKISKDYKELLQNWHKREYKNKGSSVNRSNTFTNYTQEQYTDEQLEEIFKRNQERK